MGEVSVGFYGKLPSHGDFLHHQLPGRFVDGWDGWLQRSLVASRASLNDRWLPTYLTSPAWRFALAPEVIDDHAWAGVLLPSVDRVGRYFPFTVAVALPPLSALVAAGALQDWLETVETLALDALESEAFDLRDFTQVVDASLQQVNRALAACQRQSGQMVDGRIVHGFPHAAANWRFDLHAIGGLAHSVGGVFDAVLGAALAPMALWWTEGSEHVAGSWLCTRGLPEPAQFTAMLGGDWQAGGWAGATQPAAPAPQQIVDDDLFSPRGPLLQATSGAHTDAGKQRPSNQDACVQRDDIGVWVVADGMGGHRHGDVASRMIVDAIAAMPGNGSLTAQVETTRQVLSTVNARLRHMARQDPDNFDAGSTVVAVVMRDAQAMVLWAGDSRLYRLRGGVLEQLTMDHTPAYEMALQAGSLNLDCLIPAGSSNEITRAVGGEDSLELDIRRFDVQAGDRFLLCSDGVYNELQVPALSSGLQQSDAGEAAAALLRAVLHTPARDNATALCIFVDA